MLYIYIVFYIFVLKFFKVDFFFEFYLQNVIDEDKKKENQVLWIEWLNIYVERLKKEADKVIDLTVVNQRRKEVMNMINFRQNLIKLCFVYQNNSYCIYLVE